MEAILTFATTHHAIRSEQLLLGAGFHIKVMPLPNSIRAGCGLCLRIDEKHLFAAWELLNAGGIPLQESYAMASYKPLPPKVFTNALSITRGDVVSIIGCGGKTSLMNRLAMENRCDKVLLSTTTKIKRPGDDVLDYDLLDDLPKVGVNLLCALAGEKLGTVSPSQLAYAIPSDGFTFIEADGSRMLPLKGWADHEPCIHPATTVTVGVCTLWPLGSKVSDETVHRQPAFKALTGAAPGDTITLTHIAHMIAKPGGMFFRAKGKKILFINQVETASSLANAKALAALLPPAYCSIYAGSLHQQSIQSIGADTI